MGREVQREEMVREVREGQWERRAIVSDIVRVRSERVWMFEREKG